MDISAILKAVRAMFFTGEQSLDKLIEKDLYIKVVGKKTKTVGGGSHAQYAAGKHWGNFGLALVQGCRKT